MKPIIAPETTRQIFRLVICPGLVIAVAFFCFRSKSTPNSMAWVPQDHTRPPFDAGFVTDGLMPHEYQVRIIDSDGDERTTIPKDQPPNVLIELDKNGNAKNPTFVGYTIKRRSKPIASNQLDLKQA